MKTELKSNSKSELNNEHATMKNNNSRTLKKNILMPPENYMVLNKNDTI